jgi:hypothetical protein
MAEYLLQMMMMMTKDDKNDNNNNNALAGNYGAMHPSLSASTPAPTTADYMAERS